MHSPAEVGMPHDPRLIKDESKIEQLRGSIPTWIRRLERPKTPCIVPAFGPLEGIRAVGTGQLIAQPYIGTKLAEFGAEVVHVEKPGGDVFRFTAPQLLRGPRPHGGDEAEVTKNKLSMGLDFKRARGIELLMALWKISDVWMESSAPGTCERNSITNELALAVNPSLVIVRVSTYGQYGKQEYLGRPGYDAIAQAFGGMMNLTGDPAGPPQRAKSYTGDYVTALTGWAATMMALWEVKKTGRGQVIDLAQYEAVAQTNGNTLPIFTGEGTVYGHTGNRPAGFQPYDTFKCSDGWAFIGVDPVEYSYDECSKDSAAVNSEKGREVDRRLRDYCAAHTTFEVETALNAAQIGCARVFNVRDQYNDEHYAARDMTVPVLDRQSGVPIRVFGVVPKMSLTPGRIWRGAPSIGDDTSEVLSTMLGLSHTEIDGLYADGIVHRTDPFTEPQVAPANP
jgi:crotonobetainyl-CoA:carnitine CoA-transferase CaiB-like acyl-CoA transferase